MMTNNKNGKNIRTENFLITFTLCLCSFTQAYLLLSVFSYAGYFSLYLLSSSTSDATITTLSHEHTDTDTNVTIENIGKYVGWLSSSYMIGQALSSYFWGKMSDIYGCKFVLCTSLVLSALFSLLFGTSTSFTNAILWRFSMGFSSSIIATVKTIISDMADGDSNEEMERKNMGLVIGMRGWGFLIGPTLGGILSEPLKQYPNSVSMYGTFVECLFRSYPFILPNLVSIVISLVGCISVIKFLPPESHRYNRRGILSIPQDIRSYFQSLLAVILQKVSCNTAHTTRTMIYTTNESTRLCPSSNNEYDHDQNKAEKVTPILSRENTLRHLWSSWLYSFVNITVNEAFPLFCISKVNGLYLSEALIGKILCCVGVIFVLLQYITYSTIVEKIGLYRAMMVGALLGIPPVIFFPLYIFFSIPESTTYQPYNGTILQPIFLFMILITSINKIFSCVFIASNAIALNKTVPSNQRATMNGINMVGCSIARALGPIFCGYLVSFGYSDTIFPSSYGSSFIFSTIATLGLLVVCQVSTLRQEG